VNSQKCLYGKSKCLKIRAPNGFAHSLFFPAAADSFPALAQNWSVSCNFRCMKKFILLLFLFLPFFSFAQKNYLIHLTIDKIVLGKDSVVFKKGKTFLVTTDKRTEKIEIGEPGKIPVAIEINVRKIKVGEKIKYQIGYAFFKKIEGNWTLIRDFGYVDRYELNDVPPGLEKSGQKKNAHDEYHCQNGSPTQFEAFFRLDVYKK
jgi:hypothetical protein